MVWLCEALSQTELAVSPGASQASPVLAAAGAAEVYVVEPGSVAALCVRLPEGTATGIG